jgi:hypothetical protein
MLRNLIISLFILSAAFLCGCAQVPLDVNRFDPVLDRKGITTVTIANETFAEYETPDLRLTTAIFEFNGVIANSLEIRNNSDADLPVSEYSFSLADGRDLKPIKILSRQDLVATRTKLAGGGSSGNIQDQLIQATVDTILNSINTPTKNKLINIVDEGIKNYFSFRPVYAQGKRSGVICFLPDFQLEYPLTLTVKVRGETACFKFNPRKK